MKVEFDMPIEIGDTIYTIYGNLFERNCCECPEAENMENGICKMHQQKLCNSKWVGEIEVNSYYPYVELTVDNKIKLKKGYYKTKEEAEKAIEDEIEMLKKANTDPYYAYLRYMKSKFWT